jgi:hypothetical protein
VGANAAGLLYRLAKVDPSEHVAEINTPQLRLRRQVADHVQFLTETFREGSDLIKKRAAQRWDDG